MSGDGGAPKKKSDIGRLLDMVHGFRQTAVITAALEVGVFERLADGACGVAALAVALGVHEGALGRLLRALAAFGLVDRVAGVAGVASVAVGAETTAYALTPMGKLLVKGGFGVRDWAHLVGAEYMPAWARLAHSVRTGETAFEHVFGESSWAYRKAHPEDDAAFNRVMAGAQARAAAALLDAWDFSAARVVVDVGGGRGQLLAAVLKRFPEVRGVLFDQPHVVADVAGSGGAANGRVEVVGGSFLEPLTGVPAGDVLLLKHCLHNWGDAECVAILGHCRAAMAAGGALLVLEDVMPEAPGEALVMLDLHMLAVAGGRERTLAEHARLMQAAGLTLERHIATKEGAPDVLVARATT